MPDSNSVRERVRSFVMSRFPLVQERGLGDSESLLESGAIDSLGILDVVGFLESEFGLEIRDEDLSPEHFDSIGALVVFVEGKQG